MLFQVFYLYLQQCYPLFLDVYDYMPLAGIYSRHGIEPSFLFRLYKAANLPFHFKVLGFFI